MTHHSEQGPLIEEFKKLMKEPALESVRDRMFGPTDRFPEGKISSHDEGEIKFGVAEKDGKVFVDFGTPVHSLGLTKAQACQLGQLLITRAGRRVTIHLD